MQLQEKGPLNALFAGLRGRCRPSGAAAEGCYSEGCVAAACVEGREVGRVEGWVAGFVVVDVADFVAGTAPPHMKARVHTIKLVTVILCIRIHSPQGNGGDNSLGMGMAAL